MGSILIGPKAVPVIQSLARALKRSTLALNSEMDGVKHKAFTPWMSCRPLLKAPIKDKLLTQAGYKRGDLITDKALLKSIQTFITGQGKAITAVSADMPVAADEWPVMENIAEERPDAIAAFKEGRAMIKTSPFLDALYDSLVECFIPQKRQRPSGFDAPLAFGAVFRSFPEGGTGLLAGFQIAHAMGHQAAILFHSTGSFVADQPDRMIKYSVRNDTRTAHHAIVSAVALSYMVELHHSVYGKGQKAFIGDEHVRGYDAHLPDAVHKAVGSIRSQVDLSPLGKQMIKEISAHAGR